MLRFPTDHPGAKQMQQFAGRLVEAKARITSLLDIEFDDPITAFLYRDNEQGKRLTGRDLDFANPEDRAFHQRPNSTLAHELVHVLALRWGYAGSGLFGEGLAVWLDGRYPDVHHARARKLLEDGELPSLDRLLSSFRSEAQGYPAAAPSWATWSKPMG